MSATRHTPGDTSDSDRKGATCPVSTAGPSVALVVGSVLVLGVVGSGVGYLRHVRATPWPGVVVAPGLAMLQFAVILAWHLFGPASRVEQAPQVVAETPPRRRPSPRPGPGVGRSAIRTEGEQP